MSPVAWVVVGVALYVLLVSGTVRLGRHVHRRREQRRVANLPLPVLQEELRARERGEWP